MLLLLILTINWTYSLCHEFDHPQQGVLNIPSWNFWRMSLPDTCTRCRISLEGSQEIQKTRMAISYRDQCQPISKVKISLCWGVVISGRFKMLDNPSTPQSIGKLTARVYATMLTLILCICGSYYSGTFISHISFPSPCGFHWEIWEDWQGAVSNSDHIF